MKKAALAIAAVAMLASCGDGGVKKVYDEATREAQPVEAEVTEDAGLTDENVVIEAVEEASEEAVQTAEKAAEKVETKVADAATGATEQRKWKATDGVEYLKANAKRKGVKTTPSGLQYEVLKQGTGAKPGPTDNVTVHYTGKLIDGTVFDSSVERGEPITFPLNRVIAGWTEGLQLMPVGSKYRLYIPADLGYGSRGAGGVIPPNAALVFDVELLDIQK